MITQAASYNHYTSYFVGQASMRMGQRNRTVDDRFSLSRAWSKNRSGCRNNAI